MQNTFFRSIVATAFLACFSAAFSTAVFAQSPSIKGILSGASDGALDKLAQPGAFFADKAVRISLPGPLEKASGLLKLSGKSGLTKDLAKSINEVAGLAANEAKPVFRKAIDGLSVKDSAKIVTKNGGATQYLRESSGDSLRDKVRPLVFKAMGDVGAFQQMDKLSSIKVLSKLGINNDGMTDHVTSKTMEGIFKYMAAEEDKVRKNPLKALGGILGIKK